MLPVAVLAHSAYGRTRLRITGKHRPEELSRIEERLEKVPGIDGVKASPVTGTVLVRHRAPLHELAQYAEHQGIFRLEQPAEHAIGESIKDRVRALDRKLGTLSGGALDIEALALLTLLGVGTLSLLRGQVAVPAITAFWYAAAMLGTPIEGGRAGRS